MDRTYWLLRGQSGLAQAKAALAPPFLLPSRGPATDGEREALRLPLPVFRTRPGLPDGRKRDAGKGTGR